jgi:hypothetical protein
MPVENDMIQSIRSCHRGEVIYTSQVRLSWKLLRLAMLLTPVIITGCGGIDASQTVSPASFLLPGLLKNDCPTNTPGLTPVVSPEIASVN